MKQAFESDYAQLTQTRSDDEPFDQDCILAPGEITPLWDEVLYGYNGTNIHADAPFEAYYGYLVIQKLNDTTFRVDPLPHSVSILKDPETQQIDTYMCFLIPEPGAQYDESFSGILLYTTLSGCPVVAGKYTDGTLSEGASLCDSSIGWDIRCAKMESLLQNIEIARTEIVQSTRAIAIEAVDIIGKAPIRIPIFIEDDGMSDIIDRIITTPPSSGTIINRKFNTKSAVGRGGGDDSSDDNSYSNNSNIKVTDAEIKVLLDSMYQDCIGQLLINGIDNKTTITVDADEDGGKLQVSSDGSYNIIVRPDCDMIPLMEELTHIYQGCGSEEYKTAALNKEIEAKLIWLHYLDRTGQNMKYSRALGGDIGAIEFSAYKNYIISTNGQKDQLYYMYQESVAEELQKIRVYSDSEKYPFDENVLSVDDVIKLINECLNK